MITTAFLWVVLVPWVARALAWADAIWSTDTLFSLPRSLRLAYVMSWFFLAGQAVYWCFCPTFLQRFGSYAEYEHARGPAFTPLKRLLTPILKRMSQAALRGVCDAIIRAAGYTEGSGPKKDDRSAAWIENHIEGMVQNKKVGQLGESFDAILQHADQLHKPAILVSAVCFWAGLVNFTLLAVENFAAVWKVVPLSWP